MVEIVSVLFVGINLYLWSLPMSQPQLLLVAAPLALAFFCWLLWFVARKPADSPGK